MSARRASGPVRALFGRTARLRWFHLLLGGALMMPCWLFAGVLLTPVTEDDVPLFTGTLASWFWVWAAALPVAAVTALAPVARPLSVAAARALCSVPATALEDGPARTWSARLRVSAWFSVHSGLGALVSGATLAVPPFASVVILTPFLPRLQGPMRVADSPPWILALLPVAGTGMLLALAVCAALTGRLLAALAPRLLGPTPADRLAASERRAAHLAERNRIARELHDSVGHALSAVTLQAGAARRVLDRDPAFVREALTAIEETTRRTVGELDAVLGLLREDRMDDTTGPGLEALDGLLAHSGLSVALSGDDLSAVPERLSREAYRIVQEGLTNVLRHSGNAPAHVEIRLRDAVAGGRPSATAPWWSLLFGGAAARRADATGEGQRAGDGRGGRELEITVENPLPASAPARRGGGRGLQGITERAALLGGRATAGSVPTGPGDAVWRLVVRLPLDRRDGTREGGR
ncbi:histidine kinase [Streptomyces yaizuensis]|uniref:histidine kinase n=1 Tax=Streptomyces yaizuensis TaxID=2989713 RepID=A0ABQ5P7U0_9ACTN|nr:histidine kinase [Streptomyces sp. YSPA8]GLF98655.1 histidine kinase [Streptomyces sp. YSPA8]